MPRKTQAMFVAVLPALLVLGACRGEQQQEQQPAAEQQPAQEVAQATYELQVTNTMAHPMTVYAEYGAGEIQLGTVESMQTSTFTITQPTSMTVNLRAEPADKSHTLNGQANLMAGMAASWTIQ